MNTYAQRIEALRAMMRSRSWDAVILTGSDPHGSEYPARRWKQVEFLTGFTGEAGDVVITQHHAGLWTDSRYFIQAVEQLAGSGVVLHKTRIPEAVSIPQWLSRYEFPERTDEELTTIALDSLCVRLGAVEEIREALPCRIAGVRDLLSPLWEGRPEIPSTPILTLGEDLCGESRSAKIGRLRAFLAEKGCDAILLSSLDEIAWLLNVRGSDIDFNPLVISYLLVSREEVNWYVRKEGPVDEESRDSFYELRSEGIHILPYEDISIALGLVEEQEMRRLYLDESSLNLHLYEILNSSERCPALCLGPSPVALWKAVKNGKEIAGMRDAHIEDGVAMERFLYWLETALAEGQAISEADAARRLSAFRAEIPGYRGDSFATISAYGPAAALPHYVTPEEDAPLLRPVGLYLVDSGGQYLFGTTDITRTLPLGPCSDLEKEDYTLVLKGHIGLARAIFPAGTAGCQIDALAREPLWRTQRNYGHGTGHGVGFFLCVHEGPQDIRQNFNTQPLLDGMIVSNEPGLYREGQHGIRHENLLLCRTEGENAFGRWLGFETLTLCHFDTSLLVPGILSREETAWLNDYNERVFRTLSPRLPEEVSRWLRHKTLPV